jgi:hypothetical protein
MQKVPRTITQIRFHRRVPTARQILEYAVRVEQHVPHAGISHASDSARVSPDEHPRLATTRSAADRFEETKAREG